MPTLVSKTEVYEYDLESVKRMVADDMKVPADCIHITFLQGFPEDDGLPGYSQREVKGLQVTVDRAKMLRQGLVGCQKHEWFDNSIFHESVYRYKCRKCNAEKTSHIELNVKDM